MRENKKEHSSESEELSQEKSQRNPATDDNLQPEEVLDWELPAEEVEEPVSEKDAPIEESLEQVPEEEMEYISDRNAAMLMTPSKGGRFLIYTMFIALAFSITWASVAPLAEITRGMGIVIPSLRLQVVHNLEGGILEEIYVEEGAEVKAGAPLMRLDDTRFVANYRESAVEYYSDLARASRLKAELSGQPLKFPPELDKYQDYMNREKDIFEKRNDGLKAQLDVSNKQVLQAKHELTASEAQLEFLKTSHELGEEELELTKPLAKQGVVSRVELIQLKQRVNDLDSEQRMTELTIPEPVAAHQELLARHKELILKFREEVVQELQETVDRLNQLTESHSAMQDKVTRTLIRPPLDEIIKKIHINTLGGVVQPGMDLMEIVPIEDNLLAEAKISPKDIGFLHEGMKTVVKLTAHDFAIYGGLDGTLEHISRDTIKDEKCKSFYVVPIQTNKTSLGTPEKPLEIIRGMRTSVDIITGEKTLMGVPSKTDSEGQTKCINRALSRL